MECKITRYIRYPAWFICLECRILVFDWWNVRLPKRKFFASSLPFTFLVSIFPYNYNNLWSSLLLHLNFITWIQPNNHWTFFCFEQLNLIMITYLYGLSIVCVRECGCFYYEKRSETKIFSNSSHIKERFLCFY